MDDKIENAAEDAKGKAKEATGKATEDGEPKATKTRPKQVQEGWRKRQGRLQGLNGSLQKRAPNVCQRLERTRIAKLEFPDFKPDNFGSRTTLEYSSVGRVDPFVGHQICVSEIAAADL